MQLMMKTRLLPRKVNLSTQFLSFLKFLYDCRSFTINTKSFVYFPHLHTRFYENGYKRMQDFCQATWNRCSYPPAAPLAAKTLFSFAKRLPCKILEKKNAMYQRIAQPILSRVLHFSFYNFSYLKHPNGA